MKDKYIQPMNKLKEYLLQHGEITITNALKLTGVTVGNFNNFLTQFTYYCNVYEYREGKTLILGIVKN